MSDNPQPGGSHPRNDPEYTGQEEGREAAGQEASALVNLRSSKSLERLRDRIQRAAGEITRLRDENAALAARLAKLEAGPQMGGEAGLALRFDEDPELLRRKISGFIESIDRYLEAEHT